MGSLIYICKRKHLNIKTMGHINLQIRQNMMIKGYILSSAEYLEEAWLAEVHENGNTRIVRQFKCKEFRNCFEELKQFVNRLGEVKKLSCNGIKEQDVTQLENILLPKSDVILPVNEPAGRGNQFWNWLQHDRYLML
jgi:hypothetical protein